MINLEGFYGLTLDEAYKKIEEMSIGELKKRLRNLVDLSYSVGERENKHLIDKERKDLPLTKDIAVKFRDYLLENKLHGEKVNIREEIQKLYDFDISVRISNVIFYLVKRGVLLDRSQKNIYLIASEEVVREVSL